MREKARQRKAEEYLSGVLRSADDQDTPLVLFEAYAAAADRHGLQGWRGSEERPTVGETTEQARASYGQVIDAMAVYVLRGGNDCWDAFTQAVFDFIDTGIPAVLNARDALYDSAVGFSEHSDPAFIGLIEQDDQ